MFTAGKRRECRMSGGDETESPRVAPLPVLLVLPVDVVAFIFDIVAFSIGLSSAILI